MDWIVLLPPIAAIALALWTKEVYLSLFAGLLIGTTILVGGNPVLGMKELVDQLVLVFQDPGNTRIVFFCLLVGGLMALVQASGGVIGFVNWAQSRGWGQTRRGAELLAWVVGLLIFVESSITCLVVGAVNRPFFDKLKLPREKLAFYCDSTSAAVCMSLPLNGWGAYILGLLAAQGVTTGAVGLLASGLMFNFYSWLSILFALGVALFGWQFGSMKKAEERALSTGQLTRPGSTPLVSEEVSELEPVEGSPEQARDLLIPLGVMVGMIFVGLWITGDGDMMQGSGSTSVLWAVGTAIMVAAGLYAIPRNGRRVMSPMQASALVLKGSAGLVGVTVLIVFAFALGQVSRALEMGPYVVGLVGDGVPTFWIPALVFVVTSFISFTLGSSWTAFAVLLPIALPLAAGLGISEALMLGAVLSGGVWGDHASPLSDTSIISSMSAACDHVDHIRTQMPYAFAVGGVAFAAYLVAGILA
ncbi:MAG: sodium:proton antiporter [Rhodothermales bacterium]|nr:sodium:proton antiporter [Rhodothermales bacterium]